MKKIVFLCDWCEVQSPIPKKKEVAPFVMRGWKLPCRYVLTVGQGEPPHVQIRSYKLSTPLEARTEGFRLMYEEGWEWATFKEEEILSKRKTT